MPRWLMRYSALYLRQVLHSKHVQLCIVFHAHWKKNDRYLIECQGENITVYPSCKRNDLTLLPKHTIMANYRLSNDSRQNLTMETMQTYIWPLLYSNSCNTAIYIVPFRNNNEEFERLKLKENSKCHKSCLSFHWLAFSHLHYNVIQCGCQTILSKN